MFEAWELLVAFAAIAAAAAFAVLLAYRRAGGAHARPALAAAALTLLAGAGLYFALGQPNLPGAPYAQRIAALKARPTDSYTVGEMLARLAAEAREHPSDPRPHLATGAILAQLEQYPEAARAFDAALRRDPANTFAMLNLARALYFMDEGRVGENAQRLFEAVARAEPDDPTAWFYLALAATQEGRDQDARRLWRETLQRLPADDPRRQMARRMIAASGSSWPIACSPATTNATCRARSPKP